MTTIHTGNTTTTGFVVTSDTTGDLVMKPTRDLVVETVRELVIKTGGDGGATAVTVGDNQIATFVNHPVVPVPIVDIAVTANQSLSSWTKITILSGTKTTGRDTDTNGFWDNDTNSFRPTIAGWYNLNLMAVITASSNTAQALYIGRNPDGAVPGGDFALSNTFRISTSSNVTFQLTGLMYFNGTTDYAELFAYSTGTSPTLSFAVFQSSLVRAT